MARVTIEECWWSDPRRSKLIRLLSSEDAADARVMRMWRLAQEFWKNGRQLVPRDIFETLEDWQTFIDCKLAEVRDDGLIYVRGSSQYLDWAHQARLAASAGGKKSAETRRKKYGSAQPKPQKSPKRTRSAPEVAPKPVEPSVSGSDLGSGLGLVPDSGSDTAGETLAASKPQAFVAMYCRAFKQRWKSNPPIMPKQAGILKRLSENMSAEKFAFYLDAYFQMPDASLVKAKHPIDYFETKFNEVVIFAEQGNFTTQTQARQADTMAANHLLMEKLKREGK